MTHLSLPSTAHFDAWIDCVRDFGDGPKDGSGDWQVPGFGPTLASFEALLEVIRRESDAEAPLPQGHVHSDYYWVMDGSDMLGFLAVRHSIDTEYLRTFGGHIGYSIRPSRRRRGHAFDALGLGLARAEALGLGPVLLTCDEDNVASARTIEKRGGIFESTRLGKRRYWIQVSAQVESHAR